MNISIFGLGYVGCVSLGCLAKLGHRVIGVDVGEEKVNHINSGIATIVEKEIDEIISEQLDKGNISATTKTEDAVLQTDISIICVGTPSTDKGHLNLEYIFNVSRSIGMALHSKKGYHVVVVRSTILPGTCDKIGRILEEASGKKLGVDFDIVDNPEFLREGTAVADYFNPPLTLIGGNSEVAMKMVAGLYHGLPGEVIFVELGVAEIMKYVNNTFHALKISFANEIGNICSELDIDSHKVMEILCKDKQLNISPYYLKPGFAYGGSCLPKDLGGLQTLAHDLYVDVPLINNIHKTNEIQIQRAIKKISKYFGKSVLILGLSFKAGTDDLRNSPFVELVENLLGKGFDLSIYDENIQVAQLTGKNKEFIDKKIPHLTDLLIKTDLVVAMETADILIVSNKELSILEAISNIEGKIILDMVGIQSRVPASNKYIGINW
jgi:GDP-mannose 6-dehydrogenase